MTDNDVSILENEQKELLEELEITIKELALLETKAEVVHPIEELARTYYSKEKNNKRNILKKRLKKIYRKLIENCHRIDLIEKGI
ncbi:MAG: hypothetical protein ABSF99_07710 [Anaerolineales bacterium]|jgi:hypothetical protein